LIDHLFDQFHCDNEVLTIAKDSLERKKQQKEKDEVTESDKSKITIAIKNYIEQLGQKTVESSNNRQKLESVLTDYSFNLKSQYYGKL
jgi:aminopeptidase N